MADIISGEKTRFFPFLQAPETTTTDTKDKIVAPPTGKMLYDTTPEASFIEMLESVKEEEKKGVTITGKGPSNVDSIMNAIDSKLIDLSHLDYQYSGSDMTLMGKFDRIKYLKSLRRGGRITDTRYISLLSNVKLTIEEAALLEAEEVGRPVDPDEILRDPLLMDKYGIVELDADLMESIEELQEAGVDVMADVPAHIRFQVGRHSGEEAKLQALENLKEDGHILHYKPSKLGMIITIDTPDGPKDMLFDEIGLDGNDFLDIVSEIPGIAANIGVVTWAMLTSPIWGIPVAGTTVMGISGLAALSGLSYFTGATAGDLLNRLLSKNQVLALAEIAKDRGIEGAIAAGLDFLFMGGVHLSKGIVNKAIGPLAGSGDEVIKKYLMNIAHGKQVVQYDEAGKILFNKDGSVKLGDLQLGAGLSTQSQTIQRVEGIAGKIPGGADILKMQEDILTRQLTELEMKAKGIVYATPEPGEQQLSYILRDKKGNRILKTSEELGTDVSKYVSRQLNEDEAVISAQRHGLKTQIDNDLDSIAASLSSDGKTITSASQVGDDVVTQTNKNYKSFLKDRDTKLKNLKDLKVPAGGDSLYKGDKTIFVNDINNLAKRFENASATKTKVIGVDRRTGEEIIKTEYLLPKQLRGTLIDDLKNLDTMTVDKALSYRGVLKESLSGETIPTDADKLLMKIITKLDDKIGSEMKAMGTKVLEDWNKLMQWEELNGGIYNHSIIKKILNKDISPEKVIVPAILNGDLKTIRILETALGKDNPLLQDAKSAAFNEMLRKSRSVLGEGTFTNPRNLWDQIQRLPDESQKYLLGKDWKKVKNLLNLLAEERGMVDISQLSEMKGTLAQKLKTIIALENAAEKNWKNKFLKPFQRNAIDETTMKVEDFVRYFIKTADSAEIKKVMSLFSSEMQEDIRKVAIQEILQSGRTGDPDLILREYASGTTPPHNALYKALLDIAGGTKEDASRKLVALLGEDTLNLLQDIAGIRIGQRVKAKVAEAAGGLISGSIIAKMLRLDLPVAYSILKYRIAAKILANPLGRQWLSSQWRLPETGHKTVGFTIMPEKIRKLVFEEFENEPDNLKIVKKMIENSNNTVSQRKDEDREYNKNVTRNRQPIAESNQRVIQPVPEAGAVDATPQPVAPAVNQESRLASAFNPAGMMPAPTAGAINPNTMARGQQLFNKPGEITFAAQGGIMSTNKAFQRVA